MIVFYLLILYGAMQNILLGFYTFKVVPENICLFSTLYFICLIPFISFKPDPFSLKFNERNALLFSKIYICISILFLLLYVPKSINTVLSGNYLDAYQAMRGDFAVDVYDNILEHIVYSLTLNFQIPALIFAFVYFSRYKLKFSFVLMLSATLPMIILSLYKASRTDLFQLVILVYLMYGYFFDTIPSKYRKWINLISFIFLLLTSFSVLAITFSRFDGKNFNDWFWYYFGESILGFNTIMEELTSFSDGKRFFLYDLDSQEYVQYLPNFRFKQFVPLFARFYIDFNYWGFLVSLFPLIFFPRRKLNSICGVFLIFTICNYTYIGLLYSALYFGKMLFIVFQYIIFYFLFKNNKLNLI